MSTTTINKHQMRRIFGYLDAAAAALAPTLNGYESSAAWNLRIARGLLYQAAIGEVAFAREHGITALAAFQTRLVDPDLNRPINTASETAEATGNPPVDDDRMIEATP